jgi:hypothetical protein
VTGVEDVDERRETVDELRSLFYDVVHVSRLASSQEIQRRKEFGECGTASVPARASLES